MAGEVFVGRRDELARFAALLAELTAASAMRRSRWRWRRRHSRGDSEGASRSPVVLVHGLGGSGKSRLLRQFRDMVQGGKAPGSPVAAGKVEAAWLDWADEQRDNPAGYAAAAGPSLVTVLDALQQAAITALGESRAGQAFEEYRQGAARMPEYAARFAEILAQSRRAQSPFTAGDAAALGKLAVSFGLLIGGQPGGLAGIAPGELAAAGQAGAHLSESVVRAVTGRKPGEIPAREYDLVTDPSRELARRAAGALRTVAGDRPLVVFLDTGEVVGSRAWGWLRRVMTQTGSRVAWAAGGRFETEAEAGADSTVAQFVREIGNEFLVRMSPARFDDTMIRAYLQARSEASSFTDEQIDMIARFTRGLPLAVSCTATLLGEGQPVGEVCREMAGGRPGHVVSELARRYLVHAEQQDYPADDPRREDVTKILGLALAYGDLSDDPELLGALWDVEDPLAAFQDLARRHDFVLPASRRLHEDVRDTLRADLLDPWRRTRARGINERALALFRTRIGEMRGKWSALDEQLSHPGFTQALLAVLWHALWTDTQAGMDLLADVLPVLAIADPLTADAAAAMTGQFAGILDEGQQHDLDLLTRQGAAHQRSLREEPGEGPGTAALPGRRVDVTASGLALLSAGRPPGEPLIGDLADREAALTILRAGLQAGNHDQQAAIAALRTAADQTTSTRLQQAVGSRAQTIADQLIWAGPDGTPVPTDTGLAAAQLAMQTLTSSSSAWNSYATALDDLGRHEEALAAYDQAANLDPAYAGAHINRGNALGHLGRYEEALAACDRAVSLDPGNAGAHSNRGSALAGLGRYEEALAAYDQAINLDPAYVGAHSNRGSALAGLGGMTRVGSN